MTVSANFDWANSECHTSLTPLFFQSHFCIGRKTSGSKASAWARWSVIDTYAQLPSLFTKGLGTLLKKEYFPSMIIFLIMAGVEGESVMDLGEWLNSFSGVDAASTHRWEKL